MNIQKLYSFFKQEISDIEEKKNLSYKGIYILLKLLKMTKLILEIEHHKYIYTLSDYFYSSIITSEPDKIGF